MAYIKERKRKDGGISYYVRWRAGGSRTGSNEHEIFTDEEMAKRFRDLVRGHGEQWPPGWIPRQGFVSDLRTPEEMFEPFAMNQVELRTGAQGDTKGKYKKLVTNHMVPWFGAYTVRDGEGTITREMVQRWVDDLTEGRNEKKYKYSPKTVLNLHGLMSSLMQAAVDAEPPLRATNPCAHTSLPRLDGDDVDEEMVFLEREEFAQILQCMDDQEARELSECFGETGGRWGEVTALQPRDLRRRNGRPALRIQRAWKRDEHGKPYLGAPKTKKSRRTMVITHKLDRMLRRRAKGKAPDDLLFTSPMGGQWDAGTFRRLRWIPAVELAAERFGLVKRPRIHDIRHSHAAWLIARKVPLPAIQARLGHESITTTVDTYGHLLDALDEEVMAAVEWAMDSTAPLPDFLAETGLADATAGLPAVPHQRSGMEQPRWKDANHMEQQATAYGVEPVYVVVLDGREVPFADRQHAQDVADQWNDDHAEQFADMRADGWPEDKIVRRGAVGPEERERWTGGGGVWTRMPDRQFVHHRSAAVSPDGTPAREPGPMVSRWTWEFEPDTFTTKPAEFRTEFRPGPAALTEAHARGTNKFAVSRAFDEAQAEALEVCGQSPYLDLADSEV